MTIEKIKISKKSYSQDMLETFNPYQIEEKYGGKAKNVNCYWPPFVPDSAFSVNGKSELLNDKKTVIFRILVKKMLKKLKKKSL
jgi:hypothetical protein